MKRVKKYLSIILSISLIITLLPAMTMPAAAESEDIGSENALDALGIDTSLLPEGYDPNTIENPYGRDSVTVNPVYELFVTGLFRREENTTNESIPGGVRKTTTTDDYRRDALYGHNRSVGQGMSSFFSSQVSYSGDRLWKRAVSIIDQYPFSGDPVSYNEYSYGDVEATASASGNFIGTDSAGKRGQVVTVAAGSLSKNGGLYLYFTDPVNGDASATKKVLLGTDKIIGNTGEKMSEDFVKDPYLMHNYLQIAVGDFDNNGIDEVAVYVPEQGKSRVEIYKLHTTSSAGDDFYLNVNNWKKEWTYYFNEAPFVSNMVSLTAGDFSRDGTDDLALTWGYYYGPSENNGCQAVILYGSNTNMLQKRKTINLDYEGAGIVRAAFAYGDIDGDNVNDLVLGGQLTSDIAGGNINTRFIGIYTYDGFTDSFRLTTARNFDLFEKEDGSYVHSAMANSNDKYFSSPSCPANIATVNMNGVGHAAYIYLDSILYEYGDQGLVIYAPLDQDPSFNKNVDEDGENILGKNPYYVEYGVVSADFNGDSKDTLQIMQHFPSGVVTDQIPLYRYWWWRWVTVTISVDYPGDLDMLSNYMDSSMQIQRTDAVDFTTSFCKLNTDNDGVKLL